VSVAPRRRAPRWSVYLVRCRGGALYTGIATDVARRFAEHLAGRSRGARFLRGRGPLLLVFQKRLGSLGLALRVEGAIKQLPRSEKELLLADPERLRPLLSRARRALRLASATPPGVRRAPGATVQREASFSSRTRRKAGATARPSSRARRA
jgi:putative endonuclease